MSAAPVQPSPLASALIALLQGTPPPVATSASPSSLDRRSPAPAAAAPDAANIAAPVNGGQPLPRGSLIDLVA